MAQSNKNMGHSKHRKSGTPPNSDHFTGKKKGKRIKRKSKKKSKKRRIG